MRSGIEGNHERAQLQTVHRRPFHRGVQWSFIERRAPADGALVARYPDGTPEDVDLAVEAARTAFDEGPWPHMSGLERAEILNRLADLIRDNRDRLVRIEVEEVGKPIRFARGDIDGAVGLTRYAASLAMQMAGSTYTNLGANKTALLMREPIGVVALVTPWNFPALILAQKVPFALAAGCTAVLKPSEFTSGSAFEIAALATEAGVPAGVFNVVSGYGATAGDHLTSHPGIDFVSFTGSTRTGSRVVSNTARNLVKSSVELGGKSANIVFDDADLDAAVDGALMGVFFNNGECCISGSRLFVQSSIADEFIAKVVERSRKVKVGDPFDENTDIGALIDDKHLAKVAGFVRSGVEEGAELCSAAIRRQACRQFHEATIFRPRRAGNDDLPRGDFRTCPFGHALRDARRCRPSCQRHELRPLQLRLVQEHRHRAYGCQAAEERLGAGEHGNRRRAATAAHRRQGFRLWL